MNIVYVWDADYPWDIRVQKVTSTLVKAGHSVQIAARNRARKLLVELHEGLRIQRLPFLPRWLGAGNDAISFPAFFNPLWIWHIFRVAKSSNADLIIVRDLPLALSAIGAARALGIPCVLDMAECYPEMLRCTWRFEGPSIKNFFLRNPRLADMVERVALRYLDQIWVMIEESMTRLLEMGVPERKIRIVSNTPSVSRFELQGEKETKEGDIGLHVVYVGLLNPSRGLDTAIRAAAIYGEENPAFLLSIAGSGKAEHDFRNLAGELGIREQVKFLGWIDNEDVPVLLSRADVGIVPHHKCRHWDTTIPNKLFDYMAAGLPLIVSDASPMKRIVEETGCGISYHANDVEGLVDAFRRLADSKFRSALGERGRSAVVDEYNWRRDEDVLLSSIENLG